MADAFRSVSVSVFNRYLDFAASAGADRGRILNASGVDLHRLNGDPDQRIEFSQYRQLVQASVVDTSDPALPLRYPLETELDSASIVGLIIQTSATLADAFIQLNRYAKLMMEIDVMSGEKRHPVEVKGAEAWILDARPNPNEFPELTEIALGRIVGETRALFPDRTFAEYITVTHPRPDHADLYEEYWQCPVTFGSERNGVKFNSDWLGIEFARSNAYAFGVFAEKADALNEKLLQSSDLRSLIEAHLLPDLHRGVGDAETVAEKMGVSRSTLYRRLKGEGTTFAAIYDDLRKRMAIDYLCSQKVSIKETAYLIGFSEASSFVRAFKRWMGQSPKAFLDNGNI
jgi:AraC-like DNA-binding protein